MEQLTEFVSKSFKSQQLTQLNTNPNSLISSSLSSSSSLKNSNLSCLRETTINGIMNQINGINNLAKYNVFNPAFYIPDNINHSEMTSPPLSPINHQKSSATSSSNESREVDVQEIDDQGKTNLINQIKTSSKVLLI